MQYLKVVETARPCRKSRMRNIYLSRRIIITTVVHDFVYLAGCIIRVKQNESVEVLQHGQGQVLLCCSLCSTFCFRPKMRRRIKHVRALRKFVSLAILGSRTKRFPTLFWAAPCNLAYDKQHQHMFLCYTDVITTHICNTAIP